MGINFNTLIEHSLSTSEVVKLMDLLKVEWNQPKTCLREVPLFPRTEQWEWDLLPGNKKPELELIEEGKIEFESPIDIHGTVFKNAVEISSSIRWSEFLEKAETQKILCRAVIKIADIINSKYIIYVPDIISNGAIEPLYEGAKLESVLEELVAYGEPANSLSDVKVSWFKELNKNKYYIEHLHENG